MTPCARARRIGLLAAAMLSASAARAGVWATEPVLGLQTDYSTNPSLAAQNVTATTDIAALIDLPTTYTGNGWSVLLQPTVRHSDTSGYTSLVSNYEHFTASAELDTERDAFKVTGIAQRDSSLFQEYAQNNAVGTRQDTGLADLNWVRALTERASVALDVSSQRVNYDQSIGVSGLQDYRYSSASPSLSWSATERTKLTAQASVSRYDSISGITRTSAGNVELGFSRQLDEMWSLAVNAGVSRETDKLKEYFGPFYLGTLESTSTGTVFSANLARQGPRLTTVAQASRSLSPSGFAFLSRNDQYSLQANYAITERWTTQVYVRRRSQDIPAFNAPPFTLKYTDAGASASWLFDEHWTAALSVSHITETYSGTTFHVGETLFSLQLLRKFTRREWR